MEFSWFRSLLLSPPSARVDRRRPPGSGYPGGLRLSSRGDHWSTTSCVLVLRQHWNESYVPSHVVEPAALTTTEAVAELRVHVGVLTALAVDIHTDVRALPLDPAVRSSRLGLLEPIPPTLTCRLFLLRAHHRATPRSSSPSSFSVGRSSDARSGRWRAMSVAPSTSRMRK